MKDSSYLLIWKDWKMKEQNINYLSAEEMKKNVINPEDVPWNFWIMNISIIYTM